ncbi:uncharacterized protein LOC129598816 isoform X2 [Paramacrobiotus metropolitanus]|uniref:uncharacterized protein LOC129598816 isoform X2 n=1 Tax=Paramacrobiotus metropolitanus TaxID=2943436 RepID=UPI002445F451|nr:uncharacterized protein LOC129598816 isoform X2 [Paramacrobiotus metropolitanus]
MISGGSEKAAPLCVWAICLFVLLAFLPEISSVALENGTLIATEPYINLENECNNTFELPCISGTGRVNKGGTLRFPKVPQTSCQVTVTAAACKDSPIASNFSLYFNIRDVVLPSKDHVDIYQLLAPSTAALLKTVYSGMVANPKRRSVSQAQTNFVNGNMQVRLDLVRSAQTTDRQHRVEIEYTVVTENVMDNGIRCAALDGYVDRDLVCRNIERITCPNQYEPNLYGANPAADVDKRECDNLTIQEAFRDDFTGNDLNHSRWNIHETIEMDDEVQIDKAAENVAVADGYLHMRAERIMTGTTASYRVSHISTGEKCSFLYGEVEIRAKFPCTDTLPIQALLRLVRPECRFDFEEACKSGALTVADYSSRSPSAVEVAADNGEYVKQKYFSNANLSADFHIYKMDWKPNLIVWYIDDKEIHRVVDIRDIPTQPMQFFMEVSVFPTEPTGSNETAELLVDYVIIRSDNGHLLDKTLDIWHIAMIVTGAAMLLILLVIVGKYIHEKLTHHPFKIPYLKNVFLIPESDIKILEVIGEGHFGKVWKATAIKIPGIGCPCTVAVKEIRTHQTEANPVYKRWSRTTFDMDALHSLYSGRKASELEEVRVHSQIKKRHLNIINLLGMIFSDGRLRVVLEYAPHGSLLDYLRKHKQMIHDRDPYRNYLNEYDGYLVPNGQRDESWPPGWPLHEDDLVNFAYQISRGMTHLALYNIIHRDLAARNVLVCEDKVVKICDFGLARHCTEKSEYIRLAKTDTTPLPVRWMSPETLQADSRNRVFSEKSDVWAFGVVMWEIFSFGAQPYHDVIKGMSSESLIKLKNLLHNGGRPAVPAGCPGTVYDIMQACWHYEAKDRPTFVELINLIDPLMGENARNNYTSLDEPYVRFNAHNYANVGDSEHRGPTCLPQCLNIKF